MDTQEIKINQENKVVEVVVEKLKPKRGRPIKIGKVSPTERQQQYMLDPAKREAHRLACAKYNQKLKAMRLYCKNIELAF